MQQALRRKKLNKKEIAELEQELKMPEFPKELSYLWRAYHRLRRRVAHGFNGPNPIGWVEIEAFARQTRFGFAPWEIETLEALDDAFLQPQYAALKTRANKNANPEVSEMVDVNDTKSMRSLMRSMNKRGKVH